MQAITVTLNFLSVEELRSFFTPQDKVDTTQPTALTKLMNELTDPRYSLRSYDSLKEKLNLSRPEIREMLDRIGTAYVEKVRAADGALLVGLTERN